MDESTSTVVLGFDGLDFRYLDAFRDDLPNFAALRERGVEAPLRSTHPPWTGSAWPSLYTGVEPGDHGCYTFFDYGDGYPDEAAVASRRTVDAPAIWNYLTARDAPAVVLNVPVTHPAEPVEGVLVPGYLADEDAEGHPRGIREELSTALGEPYRIYSRAELADDPREKLDGYVDLVELRGRAAAHLLAEYDWSVAVIQVQKTDAIFHNFEDPAAFRRVYRAADRVVGRVLATVPDATNVIVASDHGNGPVEGYEVFVNEILRRHGLLEATTEGSTATLGGAKRDMLGAADAGAGDPSEAGGTGAGGRGTGGGDPRARAVERLRPAVSALRDGLAAAGIGVEEVRDAARRLGVEALLREVVPAELLSVAQPQVDWRASAAYCRLGPELGVRLNVAGREPAGVVAPAEYEAVRTEVVDLFSSLRTPDGDPVFEFVERREAVYDGPHVDAAPDVVFQPAGMNHVVRHRLAGDRFRPADSFNHEKHGAFVAAGPAFESGDRGELPITAVAPLALASAGHPVPERLADGVPAGVLADSFRSAEYGDVSYGAVEADESEPAVEQRLDDLGYL